MKQQTSRCMECGAYAVVMARHPGRTARYKALQMEIPADILIPTCAECGTEWIDEDTAEALDRALEGRYEHELSTRARHALELLSRDVPQQRLERALGLSQGYLSKIKAGKAPSESLVATLMIFAHDPSLIGTTEQLWAMNADEFTRRAS